TRGSVDREAFRIGRTRDLSPLALVRCLPPRRREWLSRDLERGLAVRAPERLRPGLVAERKPEHLDESFRRLVIEGVTFAVGRKGGRVERVGRAPPGHGQGPAVEPHAHLAG